jgi:hypothetical protein
MRSPNQRSLARPKRIDRPAAIRRFPGALSLSLTLSLMHLVGCASGTSPTTGVTSFFKGAPSESPTSSAMPTPTPTPTPIASAIPVAEQTPGRTNKKDARQARAASQNAATASKEAANASAAAALASKQAASVANRIEGSGPSSSDVSLEPSPAAAPANTPIAIAGNRSTPASSRPTPTSSTLASVTRTTGLETSGPVETGPGRAAKLIQDIDKIEKRIDRKNLSADDSQRDILAQKLLQEAKKALAQRDSVAAMSLATKASTLLGPLPKLAE